MNNETLISPLVPFPNGIPGSAKIRDILKYLIETRNATVAEFLRSGTHGKLTFHFAGNDKPVRVELNTTDVPE